MKKKLEEASKNNCYMQTLGIVGIVIQFNVIIVV